MNTQAWPQVTIPQENFNSNFFDFSFVDPQTQTDSFSASSLSSMWEIPDISGMDLDQLLMSANSSLSEEDIQQIMNSFSASPGMSQALQEAGPAPFEASFQQGTIPQIHMPTNNVLPQPPMLVPSQAAVGFQPVLPSPEIPRSAGAGPSSQANSGSSLLTAISLLKLNMRFNPVFQKMGFTSCPDRIDLKAGMEREDAMIAAGYLPQTHIPWEQAIQLLGKQGFRSYYYSEIQRAKEDHTELPPVPEWIRDYCMLKGGVNAPTLTDEQSGEESSTQISLKNKQTVGSASRQNKGKGKIAYTQGYNPYRQ